MLDIMRKIIKIYKTKKGDNMNADVNEVTINGKTYVLKGSESKPAADYEGYPAVIVRTYSAWVFAWYLDKREGKEVKLLNARRLWYWDGAASLSQLAMEWLKKPENCKFPCEVDSIDLMEAIEILPVTEEAKKSIDSVKIREK